MATKAEQFKAQQQKDANPPKAKRAPRPKRNEPVDTSLPGVSASDRKAGHGRSGERNVSKRAAKKGGAKLEDSATGKPSRKSTRKSSGGAKRTSNLSRKATRKATAPKTKATKTKPKSTR
ncbi:MAG: hypothetical protein U0235_29720 [Polyangiaceae bacterium]